MAVSFHILMFLLKREGLLKDPLRKLLSYFNSIFHQVNTLFRRTTRSYFFVFLSFFCGSRHKNLHILRYPFSSLVAASGYPLKLYFQIPCVFPVRLQIFPVPIYIICEYYIHRTDLADLSSFLEKNGLFMQQLSQYPLLLESEYSQLELTKFPVFSLCLDKISKFPVFSLTGNSFCHLPCFPCAVLTLVCCRGGERV